MGSETFTHDSRNPAPPKSIMATEACLYQGVDVILRDILDPQLSRAQTLRLAPTLPPNGHMLAEGLQSVTATCQTVDRLRAVVLNLQVVFPIGGVASEILYIRYLHYDS